MAELVDLIVDGRVLFDINILPRHVCLRLIIVVVRHEILYGVLGEEGTKLHAELRGEGLVMCQHQCRTIHPCDDVRHGKRFARSRYAEQCLIPHPGIQSGAQLIDCLRLIPRRLIRCVQLELIFHMAVFCTCPLSFSPVYRIPQSGMDCKGSLNKYSLRFCIQADLPVVLLRKQAGQARIDRTGGAAGIR